MYLSREDIKNVKRTQRFNGHGYGVCWRILKMVEVAKDTIALIEAMPPILAGTAGFQPTRLMQKTLWLFVNQHEPAVREVLTEAGITGKGEFDELSMPMIVAGLGHSRTNYYNWLAMDGFKDWLHVTIQSLLEKDVLQKVHLNLMRRAQTSHDAGLIKLAMQRFDKDFVPRSATSARHEFAGYDPPSDPEEQKRAADESRRRQREVLAQREREKAGDKPLAIDSAALVVPADGFLPENPDRQNTMSLRA